MSAYDTYSSWRDYFAVELAAAERAHAEAHTRGDMREAVLLRAEIADCRRALGEFHAVAKYRPGHPRKLVVMKVKRDPYAAEDAA